MTIEAITIVTTCFAAFIQGASGFGFALVVVPMLSGLISIYVLAPMVALSVLIINLLLSLYYRRAFEPTIVLPLLLGSALGIPLGFFALQQVPASWMLTALGLLILLYAVYALLGSAMPVLKSQRWIYGAGFLSGILTGSYNLPGPPVILYGNSQAWAQARFKGNLTSFFGANAVLVVIGHGLQHRISETVIHRFLISLPGIAIGLFLGIALSQFFNPVVFRKVVLGVLLLAGVRLLILGVWS